MERSFKKILEGYQIFRNKYAHGDNSIMQYLSSKGQQPQIMVVACSDSRVDPALILQCDPGDLFVVRDVANIIPPYEKDKVASGVSAGLEFGIRFLNVKHLIILGHSQCGGIHALIHKDSMGANDFITQWVSLIETKKSDDLSVDDYAKQALLESYKNSLTFPWIKDKVNQCGLVIHTWFFDIKTGQIFICPKGENRCHYPLETDLYAKYNLNVHMKPSVSSEEIE